MKRVEFTGELGISRHDTDDGHIMRVTVRRKGVVVEIESSAEAFILALTGRAGRCAVSVNLDRMPKGER